MSSTWTTTASVDTFVASPVSCASSHGYAGVWAKEGVGGIGAEAASSMMVSTSGHARSMPRLDAHAENSLGLLISLSSIRDWRASSETNGVATCPIFLFELVLFSSMPDSLRQKVIEAVLRFSFGSFLIANWHTVSAISSVLVGALSPLGAWCGIGLVGSTIE